MRCAVIGGPTFLTTPRPAEIAAAEEDVAKNVLVAQSQAQAGRAELKRLQIEMERASQEDTQFQNRMIYPCRVGLGGG